MTVDLDDYFDEVEARFECALDFDLGLEEEFQVLDPSTLALTSGFEVLRDTAPERLRERIAGELLRSEIEVSTPRTLHFGQAARHLLLNRAELFAHADRRGFALGATGTHPFSDWRHQEIIDTPHYRAVEDDLKYVAWRNNTWAAHLHVGVRGLDRAVTVCDAMRTYLPHLLALSANSPFIEGVWTQLHSARTQTFMRMFPRCGIPDVFHTWAAHRTFYGELIETGCIQEFTQIWWAVRPHHRFGTVEVRICDAQTEPWQSLAISALAVGLIAHLARAYDEGMSLPILENRYVEENLWRAIRHGLDGRLVDWPMRRELQAVDAVRELLALAWPSADDLGLAPHLSNVDRMLHEGNGAQQQARAHRNGASIREVFAETVSRAHSSSMDAVEAQDEEVP
jgi:carboxylate-amine ligase